MNRPIEAIAATLILSVPFGMTTARAEETVLFADSTPNYAFPPIESAWQTHLDSAIARAIDPNDYICSAPTVWDDYVDSLLAPVDLVSLYALRVAGAFQAVFYMKFLFDQDDSDEYFGIAGEHTHELTQRHKDLQRFWDVPTDDIRLMAMHGSDLADADTAINTLSFLGAPLPIAQYVVATVQTIIEGGDIDLTLFPLIYPGSGFPQELATTHTVPGVPGGYSWPLLTFNAYAALQGSVNGYLTLMGDGALEGLTVIGLGINGPDWVLAHEMAHHVQVALGVFDSLPGTPEGSRDYELMADAFGAYFSAHARGATFQAKRFADVVTAAYEFGSCDFDSPNFHGTHLQREAAAEWGGGIAQDELKQGIIRPSAEMLALFNAALPEIVAPDAY